jgi:predicted RNase H-like HicB family nuclease
MNELIFLVEEDPEGGYNAKALGENIFTQADTMKELKEMIKDAVECHFDTPEQMPKMIRLHLVKEEVFAFA